jgi:hypothetical protein
VNQRFRLTNRRALKTTLLRLLLAILSVLVPRLGRCAENHEVHPPSTTVEMYGFILTPEKQPKAKLFSFHPGPGRSGYSLTWNADGKKVCSDVHYIKTMGGLTPVVKIHLINNRLLLYPESIAKSDVGVIDMLAVTRVYDTKAQKVIHSTAPYRYNHDVPLKYDINEVLRAMWMEEGKTAGDAQEDEPAPK